MLPDLFFSIIAPIRAKARRSDAFQTPAQYRRSAGMIAAEPAAGNDNS
jgi:hypothetical protein